MPMHVGADIGGTFTDLVLVSDDGTRFEFGKILTTPRQPDDAIIEGLGHLLTDAGVKRDEIIDVALHFIDVADQEEYLQNVNIERLKAVVLLGVVDGSFNRRIKKALDRWVEHIERNQHAQISISNGLGSVLKRI